MGILAVNDLCLNPVYDRTSSSRDIRTVLCIVLVTLFILSYLVCAPLPAREETLEKLVVAAGQGDFLQRSLAISKIRAMGVEAAEATPSLIAFLDDPDRDICYVTIQALGDIAPTDPNVVMALCDCLKDHDARIRRFALGSLAKAGENVPAPLVAVIGAARSDVDELVRLYAELACLSLCPAEEIEDASLSKIVTALESNDRDVRNCAVSLVGALAPRSGSLLPLLLEMLDGLGPSTRNAHLCALIAGSLRQFGHAAEPAIPRLCEQLDSLAAYQSHLEPMSQAWYDIGTSRLHIWAAIEAIQSTSAETD